MISFSRLFRAHNGTCMRHDSGAISSLILLVIGCAGVKFPWIEQASQVLQRLQLLEQAATEQLNGRGEAPRTTLVEAQNRIALLHRALQHGGRPATSTGQVVDTRVLGRPDKWDGSEKA